MTPPALVTQDDAISDLEPQFLSWMRGAENVRAYSEHTIRGYLRAFRDFSGFCKQNCITKPSDINHAWIRAFLRTVNERGVSFATISATTSAIETFFAFCQAGGAIINNPVTDMRNDAKSINRRGGRAPKRMPPVLYDKERENLIHEIFSRNHVNRARDIAAIGLLLDSGLRTEELCGLTIGDGRMLLDTGKLRVIGKGNKERVVLPLDEYKTYLIDYMQHEHGAMPGRALFRTRNANSMKQQSVHRMVSYYLRLAGIEKPQMGGHLLRHTAASRMLASGVNIRRVQEYLGHSSITTTERYLHLI
jgi:site-specific recombinase XerD